MKIFEAPISGWTVDPDFDDNRKAMQSRRTDYMPDLQHWDDADVSALRNPKTVQRAMDVFAKCPYRFNLYFIHSENVDYDRFLQRGEVNQEWVKDVFDDAVADRIMKWTDPNAINIIMTNNLSDEHKISLKSPWMLAHRIAHAVLGGRFANNNVLHMFITFVKKVTRVGYGIQWPDETTRSGYHLTKDYHDAYGKLLGHSLGTMKSARKGRLVSSHEWYYDTFAQYLVTGHVTLNPLPDQFDIFKMTRDPKTRQKVLQAWVKFPSLIEKSMDHTLTNAKGKLWVI